MIGKVFLVLIALAACASLDFFGADSVVYRATLQPVPGEGQLRLVFYGEEFEAVDSGHIVFSPSSDWSTIRNVDSVVMVATGPQAAVTVEYFGPGVPLRLLKYGQGGAVTLRDTRGAERRLNLTDAAESVVSLQVGGAGSDIGGIANTWRSTVRAVLRSACVLGLFFGVFLFHRWISIRDADVGPGYRRAEYFSFFLPLVLTPAVVLFAFWPGHYAYDAGLQWTQAVGRGVLDAPIGITATLFFRLFSHISTNPGLVVSCQIITAAVGVACILCELRRWGAPYIATGVAVLALALLPQYPLMITQFGKDAWNCIGLLFLVHALLVVMRRNSENANFSRYLLQAAVAAAFAVTIRPNTLPAVVATLVIVAIHLGRSLRRRGAVAVVFGFAILVMAIPWISQRLSYERMRADSVIALSQEAANQSQMDARVPLGFFGTISIYHMFAAILHSGVSVSEQDAALFFRIAPRSAWKYDCGLIDTTLAAVTDEMQLAPQAYKQFLVENQLKLLRIVARIVYDHPSILVRRQLCISRMLWYTGYGTRPFQTTAVRGYDGVPPSFVTIAGENRSTAPAGFRQALDRYVNFSERPAQFWLFWKPFLPIAVGAFVVLSYCISRRDGRMLVLLSLPVFLTLFLMVMIPFPAYRYQFPAVLIAVLMTPLAFAGRTPSKH